MHGQTTTSVDDHTARQGLAVVLGEALGRCNLDSDNRLSSSHDL